MKRLPSQLRKSVTGCLRSKTALTNKQHDPGPGRHDGAPPLEEVLHPGLSLGAELLEERRVAHTAVRLVSPAHGAVRCHLLVMLRRYTCMLRRLVFLFVAAVRYS